MRNPCFLLLTSIGGRASVWYMRIVPLLSRLSVYVRWPTCRLRHSLYVVEPWAYFVGCYAYYALPAVSCCCARKWALSFLLVVSILSSTLKMFLYVLHFIKICLNEPPMWVPWMSKIFGFLVILSRTIWWASIFSAMNASISPCKHFIAKVICAMVKRPSIEIMLSAASLYLNGR